MHQAHQVHQAHRLSAARLLWALACTASLMLISAHQAHAHDQLVTTAPRDGSILPVAPKALVLTFAEEPMAGTTKVAAITSAGTQVPLPQPIISGAVITVAWPEEPPGTYQAAWRLTSPDGHPVHGTWTFSYGIRAAVPIVVPKATEDKESSMTGYWIAGAGVVVGAALIIWLLRRRREGSSSL